MTEALSVVLQMDEKIANSLQADERIGEMLEAFQIDSSEMADLVNAELRETIGRIKQLKAIKADFVLPAKQIIANAEKWFDPAIEARLKYEQGLRLKLTVWTQEQARIAEEAKRKAEAEERQRRQEAERVAAAERARAEQEATEARRKAAKAEEDRLAAVAAGNAKAAAKAAAEAAAQTEKAAAVVENAEAKATETIMAAQAQVVVAPKAEKVQGFSMVDNWVADLEPGVDSAEAVKRIVAAINTGRTDLLALLEINQSAANRLAKALKTAMSVPGMVAANHPTSRSRAA